MMLSTIALAALVAAQTPSGVEWKPITPPKPAQAQRPHAAIGASATPQAVIAPAPKHAVILSAPTESVLRAGTEVPLMMAEGITTNGKKLRVGQRIRMQVVSDVRLGSSVVIPAGSLAEGEVTDVKNKGMWGKSGRIEARALNVRVGDRLIRLSGTFDDKGVTGTAGVVTSIVLLPIAGFFVTGTSANIPAGSGVKAFLDEDLRIAVQ
ncbi:MAG TPA: hypothetical protein VMN38_07190 [Sphingomicrobium sp.]|nr:hypothetical protein [Sphingomicrobium sp.]